MGAEPVNRKAERSCDFIVEERIAMVTVSEVTLRAVHQRAESSSIKVLASRKSVVSEPSVNH